MHASLKRRGKVNRYVIYFRKNKRKKYEQLGGGGARTLVVRKKHLFFCVSSLTSRTLLGANAPLGPASSEALYVCLSVCM